jgi:hypothetical protein
MAESATEESLVKHFESSVKKYNTAKLLKASEVELHFIYQDITLLSYVVLVKTLGAPNDQLLKEIADIERVLTLIKPVQN